MNYITHHEIPVLMVLTSEAFRESCLLQQDMFFITSIWKTACNSPIVRPTRNCLPPSCSSRDSALVDIVFIVQSLNMVARMPGLANDFETSSNSVL